MYNKFNDFRGAILIVIVVLQVEQLIKGGKLQQHDVARLVLLYALRYESKTSDLAKLKRILSESSYDGSRGIQDAMDKVRECNLADGPAQSTQKSIIKGSKYPKSTVCRCE